MSTAEVRFRSGPRKLDANFSSLFLSVSFLLGVLPLGVEGVLKGQKLVEQAPECPDVRLVVVRVVLENLWRHVVRSPDARARELTGTSQQLCIWGGGRGDTSKRLRRGERAGARHVLSNRAFLCMPGSTVSWTHRFYCTWPRSPWLLTGGAQTICTLTYDDVLRRSMTNVNKKVWCRQQQG